MLGILPLLQPEVWQPRIPSPCCTPWVDKQMGNHIGPGSVDTLFPKQTITGISYFDRKWSLRAFVPVQGNAIVKWVKSSPVVTKRNINWALFMDKRIGFLHWSVLTFHLQLSLHIFCTHLHSCEFLTIIMIYYTLRRGYHYTLYLPLSFHRLGS